MINITIKNANTPLSQKEYDKAILNKNTINLSNRLSSNDIKNNRKNRIQFNTIKSIILGGVIPFIIGLILIVGFNINQSEANFNTLSIQDKIRIERLAVCQKAYLQSGIKEKLLYLQIPAIRCATYMTLIYAYESNFGKSDKCINKKNCWGIKGNGYDTPRGFLRFKSYTDGRLYFAKKYFKWHYKKNINGFINSRSMTDRKTYKEFMNSKWFEIYRQLEYLLLTVKK